MKIYVDLVLLLNFGLDFLLLFSVSIILRRKIKINNFLLASFIGSLSTLFLFFNISSFMLFVYKIVISILMIICAFGYRNIKYFLNNFVYLYINSICLGGILYFINISFSNKVKGFIFINNGLSINIIFIFVLGLALGYLYLRQLKKIKNNYSNYYKLKINLDKNKYIYATGYIDSGNKLYDPYFHYPVILLDKRKMVYDINKFKMVLVPYTSVNKGFIRCLLIDSIEINKKKYVGIMLGLMDTNINIDGVDCLLHNNILEG